MRFYKVIENGYIVTIGKGNGDNEISREEYETILSVINNRPIAESGFVYKLRTDLNWELCEVTIVEVDEEATEEDFKAALVELGVSVDE